MFKIKNILLPIDACELSQKALGEALELSTLRHGADAQDPSALLHS